MTIEIRLASAADLEAVAKLAREHPYSEYRWYRRSNFDFAADYSALCAERFLKGDDPLALLAFSGDEAVGFAGVERSVWESDHFGIEMGSVPLLYTKGGGEERLEVLDVLLESVERAAGERGLRHLRLMTDIADNAGTLAIQKRGFLLVDTLLTCISDTERPPAAPPKVDPAFDLETLTREALSSIKREDIWHMADFMRGAYRIDRYHNDPWLPAERSHEVYVEWLKNILNGTWADGMYIARKEGKIVGMTGFNYFFELEKLYGVRIIGRGLSAVLPEGRGGYHALTHAARTMAPYGCRFVEFETQIQNYPVINVWSRHGIGFARGRYTFHRLLTS